MERPLRAEPGWYGPDIAGLSLRQLWRVAGGCLPFTLGVVLFKLLRASTPVATATRYPVRLHRLEDGELPAGAREVFQRLDGEARRHGHGEGFRYLISIRAQQATTGAVWLGPRGRWFLHALWADAPGPDRLAVCSLHGERHLLTTNLPRELGDGSLGEVVRLPRGAGVATLLTRHEQRLDGGEAALDLPRVEALVCAQNDDFVECLAAAGALARVDEAAACALPWPPAGLAGELFGPPR